MSSEKSYSDATSGEDSAGFILVNRTSKTKPAGGSCAASNKGSKSGAVSRSNSSPRYNVGDYIVEAFRNLGTTPKVSKSKATIIQSAEQACVTFLSGVVEAVDSEREAGTMKETVVAGAAGLSGHFNDALSKNDSSGDAFEKAAEENQDSQDMDRSPAKRKILVLRLIASWKPSQPIVHESRKLHPSRHRPFVASMMSPKLAQ